MAAKKTKVTSKDSNSGDAMYSPCMYIDLDDVKELKGLAVGDVVRVVVKGTVKSLEQRAGHDDGGKTVASIGLKDFEAEIVPASSQFDALFDDSDE